MATTLFGSGNMLDSTTAFVFSSPEPKARRWAFSIPMVRRPSVVVVRRRPQFQTWISLHPVGGSQWNFIRSIIGMGGKAAGGFGPDWIKTLVSMATDSSHRVIMEKNGVATFSQLFIIRSFLYLQVIMTCMRSGGVQNLARSDHRLRS